MMATTFTFLRQHRSPIVEDIVHCWRRWLTCGRWQFPVANSDDNLLLQSTGTMPIVVAVSWCVSSWVVTTVVSPRCRRYVYSVGDSRLQVLRGRCHRREDLVLEVVVTSVIVFSIDSFIYMLHSLQTQQEFHYLQPLRILIFYVVVQCLLHLCTYKSVTVCIGYLDL